MSSDRRFRKPTIKERLIGGIKAFFNAIRCSILGKEDESKFWFYLSRMTFDGKFEVEIEERDGCK